MALGLDQMFINKPFQLAVLFNLRFWQVLSSRFPSWPESKGFFALVWSDRHESDEIAYIRWCHEWGDRPIHRHGPIPEFLASHQTPSISRGTGWPHPWPRWALSIRLVSPENEDRINQKTRIHRIQFTCSTRPNAIGENTFPHPCRLEYFIAFF